MAGPDLPLPCSGSAATSISVTAGLQNVTVALQEVVKHVLYMHNQIPSTYSDLQMQLIGKFALLPGTGRIPGAHEVVKQLQDTAISDFRCRTRHHAMNALSRRCLKVLKDVDQLLLALQRALEDVHDIRTILLILGPSLLRPKVAYVITTDLHLKAAESDARQPDCARKVIRALIAENSGKQTSSEVPTKLFLMLQAPMQSKAPEGFLPRWKYIYDQTKVQATTHIRLTEEASPTTSMEIKQDHGETLMMWRRSLTTFSYECAVVHFTVNSFTACFSYLQYAGVLTIGAGFNGWSSRYQCSSSVRGIWMPGTARHHRLPWLRIHR
eukprot:SM000005S17213  [mRNA]  locus=s5:881607:883514:+ [translate_table: standard]